MSASIISINTLTDVDRAWEAYRRLVEREWVDMTLIADDAHQRAKQVAYAAFLELYAPRDNIIPFRRRG